MKTYTVLKHTIQRWMVLGVKYIDGFILKVVFLCSKYIYYFIIAQNTYNPQLRNQVHYHEYVFLSSYVIFDYLSIYLNQNKIISARKTHFELLIPMVQDRDLLDA